MTAVDAGVSLDSVVPNTFENRKWSTGVKMMEMMPVVCADALVEFHKQKLNVKNFDLIMIEMFGNECFYSIIEEVRWVNSV